MMWCYLCKENMPAENNEPNLDIVELCIAVALGK